MTALQNIDRLRQATPHSFGSDIVPSKHLKQFSCRFAGSGSGALPGAVTCVAGAVTAVALGTAGANYSTTTTRVLIVGDGTGASVTITGVGGGGDITGYTVGAGGTGYTTATAYVVDGPVVVVVGDSISTEQPSPSNLGASQWYLLQNAIEAANPGRNITFFNRAVGSQTWTNLNSTASSNLPSWYSNASKLWTDYIKELQPDLVLIAMGMNDRENFVFAQMNAVMTTLAGFTPQPDVTLITPMTPSAITATDTISGAVAQNGRDCVAGYMRGYSLLNTCGLVDLNRRLRLVRDGMDMRHCALREIATSTSALPWTATTEAEGDFSLDMTFTTFTLTGNTLTVYLGTTGVNTRTELLLDISGGKVRTQVRDINPSTLATTTQDTVVSTLATPSGTVGVDVIVLDQRLCVLVNDTLIYAKIIKRFSGKFFPHVEYTAAESPTIIYSAGRYARYAGHMADEFLWGTSAGGDYAGNEQNHPSGLAVASVMAPAIYEADWSHSPMTIGDTATGVTTFIGIGETDPLGRLHITKTAHSSTITPAATANNLVLEDSSAPGMSFLSSTTGIARVNFGDSADSSAGVLSYDHATDMFSVSQPLQVPTYTVAQLPSAATHPRSIAYCSNEGSGATLVFSNGSQWLCVHDLTAAA